MATENCDQDPEIQNLLGNISKGHGNEEQGSNFSLSEEPGHEKRKRKKSRKFTELKRLKLETKEREVCKNFNKEVKGLLASAAKLLWALNATHIKSPKQETCDSDYEGLTEPPIRGKLKTILEQYPEGSQIIRELVQNAEDAGANTFELLFCYGRTDPVDSRKHLDFIRGPALCAYNDSIFNEEDWKGIKSIYTSVKLKDALKIGRFGLGFKSVFHLTDTPLIVSSDRLLIINPLEDATRVCHTIPLQKLCTHPNYARYWKTVQEVFGFQEGGMFNFNETAVRNGRYSGTLFWFPLRKAVSLISKKICTPEKIDEIFSSFSREAEIILLFLKSVNNITIYDRHLKVIFQVTIQGLDQTDIASPRKYISDQLKGKNLPEKSLSVVYKALIVTIYHESKHKEEQWEIVNYFQGIEDMSDKVKQLSLDKDFGNIPYVGIAYCLSKKEEFCGHVFCFLPLPIDSNGKSLTNLPVHVNGFFSLSTDRRNILLKSDQIEDDKLLWNELIIKEMLPIAYLRLVEALLIDIDLNDQHHVVYSSLPDPSLVDASWKTLLMPLYENILSLPIFQTEGPDKKRISIEDALLFMFCEEENKISEKTKLVLLNLMKSYDKNVVVLPAHLEKIVNSEKYISKFKLTKMKASYVVEVMLTSDKYKSLNRPSKLLLLQYLLQFTDTDQLLDLEIIPTNDKSTFFRLRKSVDSVYICTDNIAMLFPRLDKFLLSNLLDGSEQSFGIENLASRLAVEAKKGKYSILEWSFEDFKFLIKKTLILQNISSGGLISTENGEKIYIWQQKLWMFLQENDSLIKAIHHLAILPEVESENSRTVLKLHTLKGIYLVRQSSECSHLPSAIEKVTKSLDVRILEALPPYLPIQMLQGRYLSFGSPQGVLDVIVKALCSPSKHLQLRKLNSLSEDVRKEFAVYLSKCLHKTLPDILVDVLKELEMFTVCMSYLSETRLYSVSQVNGLVPREVMPFPVRFPMLLIDLDGNAAMLTKILHCKEVESCDVIEKTLTVIQEGEVYSQDEVKKFMEYFLERVKDASPAQKEMASKVSFIVCGDGTLKCANELFDPSDMELTDLFLGETFRFPKDLTWSKEKAHSLQMIGIKLADTLSITEMTKTMTFIVENPKQLSEQVIKRKIKSFVKFADTLSKKSLSNEQQILSILRNNAWMPVAKRNETYPSFLPWYGSQVINQKCSPANAFSKKYEMLVGSVCNLFDDDGLENDILSQLITEPPVHLVCSQLLCLSEKCMVQNGRKISRILEEIYSYLAENGQEEQDSLISLKATKCIWTGKRFTEPSTVYFAFVENKRMVSLEPYMYKFQDVQLDNSLKSLFLVLGCREMLVTQDIIDVQKCVREHYSATQMCNENEDFEEDLNLMINIVNFFAEIYHELSLQEKCSILVPAYRQNGLYFLQPSECTYCDDNTELWYDDGEEEEGNLYLIDRKISSNVAECLGVPSITRRIMESKGIEDLEPWGQKEDLVLRIKSLIEDYKDGLCIIKEMLQNADDAGATTLKILYDERKNLDAVTGLLDKGMSECQGPALWFYNNSTFTEADFQNIVKLGGRTKEKDSTKIGKFGLGFNSVYNVTDVPSIISGTTFLIFDPRTIHLGSVLRDKSNPGLRLQINKSSVLKRLKNQFKPYNGIFGCDVSCETEAFEFDGTLFRLPLRTLRQADSEINNISTNSYRKEDVLRLLEKFMDAAGNLLLFTQNVNEIELFHLQSDLPEKNKIFSVRRHSMAMEKISSLNILTQASQQNEDSYNGLAKVEICVDLHKMNASPLFGKNVREEMGSSKTDWLVSYASKNNFHLSALMGVLPVGSTALSLTFPLDDSAQIPYGFYKRGQMFSFLPLQQESRLPVHVNGCFAVESNRRRIVTFSADNSNSVEAEWNKMLMSQTVCTSLLQLLERLPPNNDMKYSERWPLFNEDEMINSLTTQFYRSVADSTHKLFYGKRMDVRDGFQEKFYFSDCIFLDPKVRYNVELGQCAFKCFCNFNQTHKQIMDLEENIYNNFVRVGCEEKLRNLFCDMETFYIHSLLPSLLSQFWNTNELAVLRDHLILQGLLSDNVTICHSMKNVNCISTQPNGRLRKPSELVYPHDSGVFGMFSKEDERFPSKLFQDDKTLALLENLGMMRFTLTDDLLIDRVKSIQLQSSNELSVKRLRSVLRYLSSVNEDTHKHIFDSLRNIPFLPVLSKPKYWPLQWFADVCNPHSGFAAPMDIFLKECQNLVGSVGFILNDLAVDVCDKTVYMRLGVLSENELNADLITKQLSEISKCGQQLKSSGEMSCLQEICSKVYEFLDINTESDSLKDFAEKPCILSASHTLVAPKDCSLDMKEDLPPYLYKIDGHFLRYTDFLTKIGVQKETNKEQILQILGRIPVTKNNYTCHVDTIVSLLNLLAEKEVSKDDVNSTLLPDTNNIMQDPENLCFDDDFQQIQNDKEIHCIHTNLSVGVWRLFGICSRRTKFIKQFSHAVSFGQKEKLTTRLKNILSDYPCDISILNELLQNADDAGATEIHFIHDKRSHPTEGLFNKSMNDLQGPALIVFNNSSFSEKDIKGISSLGEGSKSSDPSQTGQFGIGFNAVYHLTDVPSFLSKGDTTPNGGALVIFDPHCEYLPLATVEDPGMMIDNLGFIKDNFRVIYDTYLQDVLPASKGTWFRLPLRNHEMAKKSKIKGDEITNTKIEDLLQNLKKDISRSLLFLTNVREIKISVIDERGILSTLAAGKANMTEFDDLEIQKFKETATYYNKLFQDGEQLGVKEGFSVEYRMNLTLEVNGKRSMESWNVSQAFGTIRPVKVNQCLKDGYKMKKVMLSPRAGAASRVVCSLRDTRPTDIMRAFCFLPLQMETGLPVHVNGHFALNSSRTNIWMDTESETVKGQWNAFILNEVLPFAYVKLLEFSCRELFKVTESDHLDSIGSYNYLFPIIPLIKDELWKKCARQIYQMMWSYELNLFPVLFDNNVGLLEQSHYSSKYRTDPDKFG